MRNTPVLIITTLGLLACATPSLSQYSASQEGNPDGQSVGVARAHDGTWEGVLTGGRIPDGDEELALKKDFNLRLVIAGQSASVFVNVNGAWNEIKPGNFHVVSLDTNAVILSIASGRDDDGVWVETWSFAVTVIDATHLDVMWQRQVKNKDMNPSESDAVFGLLAYGQLTRASAA